MVKSLAADAAGVAVAVAVAVTGVTVGAAGLAPTPAAAPRAQLVVFDAPLAPAADLPTAGELIGVLNGLADPAVPFADKTDLIEGGVGGTEASMADHKLHKAARKGELPLAFEVADIAPAGPGSATANVTVSGPKLEPVTVVVTFVDQDGWKLSRASALSLLQAT